MDIYILDADFNAIDVIDDYEYLVWDMAFYKNGFFELNAPVTRLPSIANGVYVYRSDSAYTGRINTYSIEGKMVVASGFFLEGMLDFRAGLTGQSFTGCVETAMLNLVRDNCIQSRAIPYLSLGADGQRGGTGTFTAFGRSLSRYFYELAEAYGISYNIICKPADQTMVFRAIEGVDRTQAQNINEWCVFSGELGNVNSERYETNTDYPNIAYVYGESKTDSAGAALPRVSVVVDVSGDGEKRELFVDAGDIRKENGVSDAAYKELLRQRGIERLAEEGRYETIDFTIAPDTDMVFGLGDICTYKHILTGQVHHLRITEIKETHEKNGMKRNIVLGRYNLGVVETLRKER